MDINSRTRHRYHHRRPRDDAFYANVGRMLQARAEPTLVTEIGFDGVVVAVRPGDVLTLRLMTGPQIVHLFAWNPDDPDERVWPHETSGMENAFLVVGSRIWSMMARFRPLLTVVEDTVDTVSRPGSTGRHHFVLGGFETPAEWAAAGGDPSIPSGWARMRSLVAEHGGEPSAYRDHVSLFQKIAVDVSTQRIAEVPTDARAGDAISLYAETALRVALVPSAHRGGGLSPERLDGTVEAVNAEVREAVAIPLGWPYPEVPYPDLSSYVDASGSRT
jgi:uncharacterized protein YcgI (DUF1989 family)